MSIQGNVNSIIGMIAGAKKFHNYELQQKANKIMEEQKLAIKKQRLEYQEYIAKTARKKINLQNKIYRDEGIIDKNLFQNIAKIKEMGKDGK